MNLILLISIAVFISILSSILVILSENKKDRLLLEKRKKEKEKEINNESIDLYKKQDKKVEYKEYLKSKHWQNTRLKALEVAGYKCQLCSSKDSLNVHHNTYENKGNEDLKDLVVLCRKCHAKFHDKDY